MKTYKLGDSNRNFSVDPNHFTYIILGTSEVQQKIENILDTLRRKQNNKTK